MSDGGVLPALRSMGYGGERVSGHASEDGSPRLRDKH